MASWERTWARNGHSQCRHITKRSLPCTSSISTRRNNCNNTRTLFSYNNCSNSPLPLRRNNNNSSNNTQWRSQPQPQRQPLETATNRTLWCSLLLLTANQPRSSPLSSRIRAEEVICPSAPFVTSKLGSSRTERILTPLRTRRTYSWIALDSLEGKSTTGSPMPGADCCPNKPSSPSAPTELNKRLFPLLYALLPALFLSIFNYLRLYPLLNIASVSSTSAVDQKMRFKLIFRKLSPFFCLYHTAPRITPPLPLLALAALLFSTLKATKKKLETL